MSWTAALWFLAIVASIPLLLWLLKRSAWLGASAGSGTARTVAVLPLSASQKVVTVELGRGEDKLWLVLGVTPGSITTLHTMPALAPLPATAPDAADAGGVQAGTAAATFSQLLGRMRGESGAPGAPGAPGARSGRQPDDPAHPRGPHGH